MGARLDAAEAPPFGFGDELRKRVSRLPCGWPPSSSEESTIFLWRFAAGAIEWEGNRLARHRVPVQDYIGGASKDRIGVDYRSGGLSLRQRLSNGVATCQPALSVGLLGAEAFGTSARGAHCAFPGSGDCMGGHSGGCAQVHGGAGLKSARDYCYRVRRIITPPRTSVIANKPPSRITRGNRLFVSLQTKAESMGKQFTSKCILGLVMVHSAR